MANDQQVQILKSSVKKWNTWRKEHPDASVDLDGSDFEGATLADVNLSKASLRKTNLRGANLSDANLSNANLSSADLRRILLTHHETNLDRANLSHAHLAEANFNHASLREADLSHARLYQTDLISADLFGAKISHGSWRQCFLGETSLINLDLSTVTELESCQHFGPSFVDFRTLELSGPLPEPFLRGCGLPNRLIENLRSLLNRKETFYSCFISYSAHDGAFADQLHADLENKGVPCWFAREDQRLGDDFPERVEEAIRLNQKLLVILSRHSLASQWVKREVTLCLERERQENRQILIAIKLDDKIMSLKQLWGISLGGQRHIGDFRQWRRHYYYKTGLERLLRDLTIRADLAGESR